MIKTMTNMVEVGKAKLSWKRPVVAFENITC
jgi:hypothetical protein